MLSIKKQNILGKKENSYNYQFSISNTDNDGEVMSGPKKIPENTVNQVKAPGKTGHKLERNIISLGMVSLFTDLSSQMVYPLIPSFLFLMGVSEEKT